MNSSASTFKRPRKRNDKGRRSWSHREEEVLIGALKDIVANGWKSENGFKIGYLQVLEQDLAKSFPGTDLRGIPHINSKIHVWKKYYSSLVTMLSRSGIGWNDSTKMIEAHDEAWELYLKVDSNARLMRFKSWPFYHDWVEIFGKDRATGQQAEDFVQAAIDAENGTQENDMNVPLQHMFYDFDELMETMSAQGQTDPPTESQQETSGTSSKTKSKKRKSQEAVDHIYELVGTFCKNTDARLGEIAKRIGYEYDISCARKEVFNVVGNIVGLTLQQKLLVSKLLVKNTEDLELFFSLPDEAKVEFAKMKLAGNL